MSRESHVVRYASAIRALFLSVPLDGSKHTAVTFCFSRFSFSSCLLLCSFRRCTLLLPKARGTEYAHVPGTIDELTATDTSSSSRPILLPFSLLLLPLDFEFRDVLFEFAILM